MAKITKADCLSVDSAAKELECSRTTLYTYMNVLGIQRIKFPFDRRSYVTLPDVERVKKFMEENRG